MQQITGLTTDVITQSITHNPATDALIPTQPKQDPRAIIGLSGEDIAAKYLRLQDYLVIFRNYRCRCGEIDIIALKGNVLTFVEVKTRRSLTAGRPAEAVTFTKQQKIRRTAQHFLLANHFIDDMPALSFDVIEIVMHEGRVVVFNHFEHCF